MGDLVVDYYGHEYVIPDAHGAVPISEVEDDWWIKMFVRKDKTEPSAD